VAIGIQRFVAGLLGTDWERVELEHVGLNHLSWERAVRIDGEDVLPDLLERFGNDLADHLGLPLELVRVIGALPSYYLRYYYLTDEVLEEQQSEHHRSRAQEVTGIERQLLEMYRDPSVVERPELLEQRGGAFYSEAAAQLIASLHAGSNDIQIVDVCNQGGLPGLADDAVVEVPAKVGRHGVEVLKLRALAPEMLGLVQHVKAYERLTVQAALSGDRQVALKALITNPLVGRYQVAAPLLDALLAANRQYLPRFFPRD
jgi:6-phospho-beta-glucosidase